MNIEEFRNYCLAKKGVTESFPFDDIVLVFKVMGKIYALTGVDSHAATANLKCNPESAIDLREEDDGLILPGYHMREKLWNTVEIEGNLRPDLILEFIDH